MKVTLRKDLAEDGYLVPAYELPDGTGRTLWLCEERLRDAHTIDTDTDLVRVELTNGIKVYLHSVDLDFEELV